MGKLSKTHDGSDANESSDKTSNSLYLIATMADTTWRMFVPTIGLLLLGNLTDDRLHSSPWLMIAGVVAGTVIAAFLIRSQLAKGKRA